MATNRQNRRIEWLDVAKGIVIILMVIGHTGIPISFTNIIFSFHMPFFFIASGITTNFQTSTLKEFFYRKLRSLGIPFILYSSVNLILWPIVKGDEYDLYICEFLKNGWGGVALWFIPILFFSLVLSKLIYNINEKIFKNVSIIFLLLLSGLFCFFSINIPWNLAVVPYASFFVIIGNSTKPYLSNLCSVSRKTLLVVLIVFAFISYTSQIWRLDMAMNAVLPLIPKTISALCGCYVVVKVSSLIEKKCSFLNHILKVVGQETYIILAFSQIIICSTNQYLKIGVLEKYSLLVLTLWFITFLKKVSLKKTSILFK